jgi:hypothetical protein
MRGQLEPSCLLPMTTGLTRLCLERVTLLPQQDSELGASQLLQLLARQTALRELKLKCIEGDWPQQQLAQQHSALTASSNLQTLRVNNCDMQGAVWAHMFPAGRQLPQLRLIRAESYRRQGTSPFGAADITRLVSCCPAVEELHLEPGADASLAPLQSLTALTSLHIRSVSPAAIWSDLAALTQLQSLDVRTALAAAGAGLSTELQHLVPLTALTGLTSFKSWRGGCCMNLSNTVSQPKATCKHARAVAGMCEVAAVDPHRYQVPYAAQDSMLCLLLPGRRTTSDGVVSATPACWCRPLQAHLLTCGCSWWRRVQQTRRHNQQSSAPWCNSCSSSGRRSRSKPPSCSSIKSS